MRSPSQTYFPGRHHENTIFVTGGTFDKEYDEITGGFSSADARLPEMLRLRRSRLDIEITTPDAHRQLGHERLGSTDDPGSVQKSARRIHRHSTAPTRMEDTARVLGPADMKKTIVLTGAWSLPIRQFRRHVQLGSALAFSQALPHGVYVA